MGRAEMPPIFNPGQLQQAKDQITGLNSQLDKTRESLSFIAGSFTDAVNEMSKGNKYLSNTKSSLNSLAGLANTLKVEAQDLTQLSEKRLLSLEKRAKVQFETLKISKQNLAVDSAAFKDAENALKSEKELLDTLKQIRAEKTLINKSSGVRTFGALEGITDAIPGLKKLTPAFQEASKAAQEQAAFNLKNYGTTKGITSEMKKANKLARSKRAGDLMSLKTGKGLTAAKIKELGLEKALTSTKTGKLVTGAAGAKMSKGLGLSKTLEPLAKLGKSIKPLMAGFKALGPLLKKALGPLAIIMEIFSLDKQTADLAKNMNLTYKEANRVRAEMQSIANSSGNNFVSGKKLLETFGSINETLGTTVETMDSELLISLTEMREMAGFTNEELQGIAAITLATGKSADDVTGEFMAQAKLSSIQNGVLLNEKDLLKGIGKISAATTLSFGKNPKLLGQAVATAKSLGMEMSKVEGIAGSLLDFESSIEAELSAELLLGKNINLEKARQAALNNDLATVAEEIAKQAGSAAEFGDMNRIKQEALAKAVGMSRDDLAQTLFIQEQLVGATGEQAAETEALLNKRIAAVGLEQAQKELAKDGVEGLKQQVGQADKMAASMNRINEIFGMIGESMMPVFEMLGGILEVVGFIIKPFMLLMELTGKIGEGISNLTGPLGTVGKLMKGLVGIAIVLAAYMAFQSAAAIPVVGWVLGPIAAATVLAAGFGALSKVGDVDSPADGKTQVSTKEGGLFELSKNDDFVAAPGASKMMQNNQSTPVTQTNQTTVVADNSKMESLLSEMLTGQTKLIKKTPEMAPLGLYEVQ